jgi:hypothetical protein
VYLSNNRTIAVTGALNPPGGIAAVIKSPGGRGTILVTGNTSPLYTLTPADVGKFRYDNAGTPAPLVLSSGAGIIP